ncbi:MAG: pseudouridine synthase [Monoraphidium minutum]|nr:MAG: pseudouridine synthase [Monoraphidium minutum]
MRAIVAALLIWRPRLVCCAAPDFEPPVGKRERKRQARDPGDSGEAHPNREQRLAKVLAAAGVASRRKCEEIIEEGRVAVNGQVVSVQGFKVIPARDRVSLDGRELRLAAGPGRRPAGSSGGGGGGAGTGLYYFAVNKPVGYICSNVSSRPGRRAVDLLDSWLTRWRRKHPDEARGAAAARSRACSRGSPSPPPAGVLRHEAEVCPTPSPMAKRPANNHTPDAPRPAAPRPRQALLPPRFFTAGRLDVGTSGLVLVTNDGPWSNRLIHPSAGLTKEYLASVAAPPSQQQLAALRRGAQVEGVLCVPKLAEALPPGAAAAALAAAGQPQRALGGGGGGGGGRAGGAVRVVVSEGRKHEVRVLVAAAGMQLVALHRARVGGLALPQGVPPGGFMELTPRQAEAVLRDGFAPRSAPGR